MRSGMCYLTAVFSGWLLVGSMAAQTLPPPRAVPVMNGAAAAPQVGLGDLIQIGLERNPRLGRAAFAIDAARGRAIQAGLYPNPTISVTGDELGDRTGPPGIWTAPQVNQEIVTAGKLRLSRAAASRQVDQAILELTVQRYTLLANIRQAYFDAVFLQRRADVLCELFNLAQQSVDRTEALFKSGLVPRLALIQLQVERERLRAELDAANREFPGAYRRLAAVVGVPVLPLARVADPVALLGPEARGEMTGRLFDALPDYELEWTQHYVLSVYPELRSAQVGVERAELLLRQAQVEPIPNVTIGAGYVRQSQNRSDDWMFAVSVPTPVWNRNQGNIRAAQAQLGEAVQEVGRVENDLAERVATAFRDFAAARARAEGYHSNVVRLSQEAYDINLRAYRGGEFEYLRVLEAQRSLTQARLEYVRALGDAWRAASVLSGLALEEEWPWGIRGIGHMPCEAKAVIPNQSPITQTSGQAEWTSRAPGTTPKIAGASR